MFKSKKLVLVLACLVLGLGILGCWASRTVLRIYDEKSGKIYVEVPAKEGDKLFFGWFHSLEKIPWHEYYHIDGHRQLILDKISFPAFGAGIPENKGKECYVKDGLIYMDKIEQVFPRFIWINSHFATKEIKLNDIHISSGEELPEHTKLILIVERKGDKWLKWMKKI